MSVAKAICSALVEATEPMSCNALAEAAGVPANKASVAIAALVNSGAVIKLAKKDGGLQLYEVASDAAVRLRAQGVRSKYGSAGKLPKASSKKTRKTKAKKPPKKVSKARKTKKRPPPPARQDAATLAFFIGEDREVQIIRADGKGEGALLPRADALRLASFLNQLRPFLEAE